jgi:hypothetical protein
LLEERLGLEIENFGRKEDNNEFMDDEEIKNLV